jgi:hypothetical protein
VDSVGRVHETAVVRTNDPLRPRIYLTLRAEPSGEVIAMPTALEILAARGTAGRAELHLTGPPALRIRQVQVEPPIAEARLGSSDNTDSRSKQTVVVELEPGLPVGDYQAQVTISTNVDGQETLRFMLSASVGHRLSVEPRHLLWSPVEAGSIAERVLCFRWLGETGVGSAIRVRADDPRVRLSDPVRQPDGSFHVPVALDTAIAGAITATIVASGELAGDEQLAVRVFCDVREGAR